VWGSANRHNMEFKVLPLLNYSIVKMRQING